MVKRSDNELAFMIIRKSFIGTIQLQLERHVPSSCELTSFL